MVMSPYLLTEREVAAIKSCLEVADPVDGGALREDELERLTKKLQGASTDFTFRVTSPTGNVSYLRRNNGRVSMTGSNGTPWSMSNIMPKDSEGYSIRLERASSIQEAHDLIKAGVYSRHTVEPF